MNPFINQYVFPLDKLNTKRIQKSNNNKKKTKVLETKYTCQLLTLRRRNRDNAECELWNA